MKPRLKWYERCTAFGVVLMIALWVAVSHSQMLTQTTTEIQKPSEEDVVVKIEGAVRSPGDYEALITDRMIDVIRRARPTPSASLKGAKHRLIGKVRHIVVPEKGQIAIFFEDAVGVRVFLFPESSSYMDVIQFLGFTPSALKSKSGKKHLQAFEMISLE